MYKINSFFLRKLMLDFLVNEEQNGIVKTMLLSQIKKRINEHKVVDLVLGFTILM